jgi:hypothetical protein
LVTVLERDGARDALPVHLCSVLAPQILDRGLCTCHDDPGVPTRESGGIDADGAVAIAAHDVRAVRKNPLATLRDKARAWACRS